MPSWLQKLPSWLRKNALRLSQSALSNFAPYVIKAQIRAADDQSDSRILIQLIDYNNNNNHFP